MIRFEHSVVINRPLEKVFAFLSVSENETQWQAGLVESKHTSQGPTGVGTTGRDVRKFMGREVVTTWKVTEYEPNKMFAFKVISGPVPFQGAYTFDRVDGGTRVTITAQAEMRGLSRLFEPMIIRSGKRQYENDFTALKKVLEAQV